ncbi:DUF2345 domain-containing protein, partial [Brevibacterium sediminis]|uniref:DUF2345 domain-containing protein n=1 Tax=Brevibacterium sediminis TaxID=1857024 RepID=UPI003B3AD888
GPLSLQAHTGELELLADQSVTLTATDERIDVLANEKIVLQAGQSRVVLEGGDITFECPGEFTVKASQHPFRAGENKQARLPALPAGLFAFVASLRFAITGTDKLADVMGWVDRAFRIRDRQGNELASGTIGEDGRLPRITHDGLGGELTLEVGDREWKEVTSPPASAPESEHPNDGSSMPASAEAPSSTTMEIGDLDPATQMPELDHPDGNRYAQALLDEHLANPLPTELIADLLGLRRPGGP